MTTQLQLTIIIIIIIIIIITRKHEGNSYAYSPLQATPLTITFLLVCLCRIIPQWAMASSITRFLDHTQRRTTVGRTPLDEWSARRRDLYLTSHNTHSRQTSMTPVGFEPTISAGERPQTHALDRAAPGTGDISIYREKFKVQQAWQRDEMMCDVITHILLQSITQAV